MKRELYEEQQARKKRQGELSDLIKSTHEDIREKGWEAGTAQNPEHLLKYASAMKTLATEMWQTSRHHDDRILWALECTGQFYREGGLVKVLEKNIRREKYAKDGVLPSPESVCAARGDTLDVCQGRRIRLLDVGSCFNPVKTHPLTSALQIEPCAIDLCPAPESISDVETMDWLKSDQVEKFRGSMDVVLMSLVLSYIPTPVLRFRALQHALRSLRYYGLLLLVHTRTQGPRSGEWITEWESVLTSLGCVRYVRQIKRHVVCQAFIKMVPDTEEFARAWDRETLAGVCAKLKITADSK